MANLKIVKALIRTFSVPFDIPWEFSTGSLKEREGAILKIIVSDDSVRVTGYGEILTSTESTAFILKRIFHEHTEPLELIDSLKSQRLSSQIIFAIESAVFDAMAKLNKIPFSTLLNPGCSHRVKVNAVTSTREIQKLSEDFHYGFSGYESIKIKVGILPLQDEIKLIRRLNTEMKNSVTIRLDANRKWDFDSARRFLSGLQNCRIEYIEEPLRKEEIKRLKELSSKTGIAAALDETFLDFKLWKELTDSKSVRVVICKPSRDGGLTASIHRFTELESKGIRTVFTSNLESGVGLMALIHLCAATNGNQVPSGLDTLRFLGESMLINPPITNKGKIQLPAKPGLNINLNESSARWQSDWEVLYGL